MKDQSEIQGEGSRKHDTKNRRRGILMLLENYFPEDVRVRQEAFTLRDAGYNVIVLAQLSFKGQKKREVLDGVTVYRIPLLEVFEKTIHVGKNGSVPSVPQVILSHIKGIVGYVLEYLYFTCSCFFFSFLILFREGFDAIHLHNPPNTPFLVGLLFKLLGKKFVFDHHDLAPELYLSRLGIQKGVVHKILLFEEALCLRTANMVIATNESYKEIDIRRGRKKPGSIFVVRNGPDLTKRTFQPVPPDEELVRMGKKILVYIGIMGPQDGVDYLIRSLHILVNKLHRTDFYCLIIGRGEELESLKNQTKELGLEDFIRFTGFIPRVDLIRYVSTADICLDPNPSSPLNDYSTWVKVLEYMAFGKPIVSFDLRETRYSAGEAALRVPPNDEYEYARAIEMLMDQPDCRKRMGAFGLKRMREHLCWEHVSKNLLAAYGWLFEGREAKQVTGQ